jgi:hypothetical protein
MQKRRKALLTYLAIGVIVGSGVFLATTQVYGVPLWWLFSDVHSLSVAQLPPISAQITPQNPGILGQQENVLVLDFSTGAPLSEANITVFYDGAIVLTESSNSTGQAIFRYAGSPTIINIQASGYTQAMYVVPNAPQQWVYAKYVSDGTGFASSLAAPLALFLVQRWLDRNKTKRKSRKRVKKSKK